MCIYIIYIFKTISNTIIIRIIYFENYFYFTFKLFVNLYKTIRYNSMIEAFLRNDYLFTAYEIFKEMKNKIVHFQNPEKTFILFQSFFKFKK